MRKVFISYHHANDQAYKNALSKFSHDNNIFIDQSVDTGDIDENLEQNRIHEKIRDEYLRDSTVTIVLVGQQTKYRKHIDWEIYSSMFDGKVNKKSGILVITLPTTGITLYTAAHGDIEKKAIYPDNSNWIHLNSFSAYQERYPDLPDRILDNLAAGTAKISVTPWDRIYGYPDRLRLLVEATFDDRNNATYDFSRDMRMRNG